MVWRISYRHRDLVDVHHADAELLIPETLQLRYVCITAKHWSEYETPIGLWRTPQLPALTEFSRRLIPTVDSIAAEVRCFADPLWRVNLRDEVGETPTIWMRHMYSNNCMWRVRAIILSASAKMRVHILTKSFQSEIESEETSCLSVCIEIQPRN